MVAVSDQIDPQKHLRRMWETAPKLAQAKANRVYMEEYRKTLKATLMKESPAKSMAEQVVEALAKVHVTVDVAKAETWTEQECVVAYHWASTFLKDPDVAPARPLVAADASAPQSRQLRLPT